MADDWSVNHKSTAVLKLELVSGTTCADRLDGPPKRNKHNAMDKPQGKFVI